MVTTLRILTFNDVYILDNLPRVKTLIKAWKKGNSIVTLPGDFLAPSLLSSLDGGFGMVDCLDQIGLDYVSLGNHECDVPHKEFIKRIKQSHFTWINSNLTSLNLGDIKEPLPTYAIIDVKGTNGSKDRKVGLVGLMSHDKALYKGGTFFNTEVDNVNKVYEQVCETLLKEKGVDVVVPLSHQSMACDRILAANTKLQNIPVILGGHDHEFYHEINEESGCHIIKTGQDASCVACVELTWDDNNDEIEVEINPIYSKDFEPDKELVEKVDKHKLLLKELEKAKLCFLSGNKQLSSKDIRIKQTTMGALLCSAMRDSFMADACMFNSGGIRAGKDYPTSQKFLSFADLEEEMPFSNDIVCVSMPGKTFSDAIAYSRRKSFLDPPVMCGGFMQVDGGVVFDDKTKQVTRINYKPIDMNQSYQVVCVKMHLDGIDSQIPLVEFAKEYPDRICDDGVSCKVSVVTFFARSLLMQLGSFKDIDGDGDGKITKEEFVACAQKNLHFPVIDFVIDKVFDVCDTNKDGYIDKAEMLTAVLFTAFGHFDMNHDGMLERCEIRSFGEKVLGENLPDKAVDRIIAHFDKNADGVVCFHDVREKAMVSFFE